NAASRSNLRTAWGRRRAAVAEPCCVEVDRVATLSLHVHDDPVSARTVHSGGNDVVTRVVDTTAVVQIQIRPAGDIASGGRNRWEECTRRRLRRRFRQTRTQWRRRNHDTTAGDIGILMFIELDELRESKIRVETRGLSTGAGADRDAFT